MLRSSAHASRAAAASIVRSCVLSSTSSSCPRQPPVPKNANLLRAVVLHRSGMPSVSSLCAVAHRLCSTSAQHAHAASVVGGVPVEQAAAEAEQQQWWLGPVSRSHGVGHEDDSKFNMNAIAAGHMPIPSAPSALNLAPPISHTTETYPTLRTVNVEHIDRMLDINTEHDTGNRAKSTLIGVAETLDTRPPPPPRPVGQGNGNGKGDAATRTTSGLSENDAIQLGGRQVERPSLVDDTPSSSSMSEDVARWTAFDDADKESEKYDKERTGLLPITAETVAMRMEQVFNTLDTDKDGFLSVKDLGDLCVMVAHRPMATDRLAKLFESIGLPQNTEKITCEEFIKIVEAEKAVSMFEVMDGLVHRGCSPDATNAGTEVFDRIIQRLSDKYGGRTKLRFPKEIICVVGPPGGGKGQIARTIAQQLGIISEPIMFGEFLKNVHVPKEALHKVQGVEARSAVEDEYLVEAMFTHMLESDVTRKSGAIICGFPATRIQAQCFSLLHDFMDSVRREVKSHEERRNLRRPRFRLLVLYADESCSVGRQNDRGRAAQEHNRNVANHEQPLEGHNVRATDLLKELASARYKYFKEDTLTSLGNLKDKFGYHYLDYSTTSLDELLQEIQRELAYQSSFELAPETFELISKVPHVQFVTQYARQQLVKRLDAALRRFPDIFKRVVEVIQAEFVHILRHQALSGVATVRTMDPVFENQQAVVILLDILSERGFQVVLDKERKETPIGFDKESGLISTRKIHVLHLRIRFPRAELHSRSV